MYVGLSVITPVFNGERYIESCINNVISQNCSAVEHIIVDGGSSDGTVEIIRSFADRFSHIRWISEQDAGQSDAMNKGIAMARGAMIGFLNVDDYYEPGALNEASRMFQDLTAPSLLVGNCNVWDNDGGLWFVSKPSEISLRALFLGRFLEAFPMNPSAYFYHRCLHDGIGPYEVDEHFGMDLHFIFKAVQEAAVVYVDRLWGNYRYLQGTKTFEDDLVGGNTLRVTKITEHYLRRRPLIYQWYICTLRILLQGIGRAGRVWK